MCSTLNITNGPLKIGFDWMTKNRKNRATILCVCRFCELHIGKGFRFIWIEAKAEVGYNYKFFFFRMKSDFGWLLFGALFRFLILLWYFRIVNFESWNWMTHFQLGVSSLQCIVYTLKKKKSRTNGFQMWALISTAFDEKDPFISSTEARKKSFCVCVCHTVDSI